MSKPERDIYTTQDHKKCIVCGQPGGPATPLIQTDRGWRCGSGSCRPPRKGVRKAQANETE